MKLKIGFFAIGLDTYWAQFEGLLDRLQSYQAEIHQKLSQMDADIVDAGMVDNPAKANIAAELFTSQNVDLIVMYVSTYALSSTVLPIAQKVKVPIVVLSLQPTAAIDYDSFNALNDRGLMTGSWLANCQSCSVPEIASVFNRADIPYYMVTGYLQQQSAWDQLNDLLDAAYVAKAMANNRIGVLGHYYCGMLDVYSDMTQLSSCFGSHFELLEMCELHQLRQQVSPAQIKAKLTEFETKFDVSPECEQKELDRAARTSCALDALAQNHNLGSLAYYYEGSPGNDYENIVTSVIAGNTLLTGSNVPVAGECEIKNVHAMKILDAFGVGGSFSEFYAMDFNEDIVLLGHDGPAHFAIAEGRVGLVPLPLYHGKPGNGLSIQMSVKHGPVTILSVVQSRNGKVSLLVAQGRSVPGPTLQIGNTNSRYKFDISAAEFVEQWSMAGPAHHCAIGVGHIARKIINLAKLLNLDYLQIC